MKNEEKVKSLLGLNTYEVDKLGCALDRMGFIKTIESLMPQIIQNWCLIRYCQIAGKTESYIQCSVELTELMRRIIQKGLKGSNSQKSRRIVVTEGLLGYIKDAENIYQCAIEKFTDPKVKIDPECDEVPMAIESCINRFSGLITALSFYEENDEKARAYIARYIEDMAQ